VHLTGFPDGPACSYGLAHAIPCLVDGASRLSGALTKRHDPTSTANGSHLPSSSRSIVSSMASHLVRPARRSRRRAATNSPLPLALHQYLPTADDTYVKRSPPERPRAARTSSDCRALGRRRRNPRRTRDYLDDQCASGFAARSAEDA